MGATNKTFQAFIRYKKKRVGLCESLLMPDERLKQQPKGVSISKSQYLAPQALPVRPEGEEFNHIIPIVAGQLPSICRSVCGQRQKDGGGCVRGLSPSFCVWLPMRCERVGRAGGKAKG